MAKDSVTVGKKYLLIFGDIVILYFSLWLTLLIRYQQTFSRSVWNQHFWPFAVVFLIWLAIFYIDELYELTYAQDKINFLVRLSRGILIAFEGIDGSGKTTQIEKVAIFLRNHNYSVIITHEPTRDSPYAQLIKNRVKKHREEVTPEEELEWYTKDREWDLKHNILPNLAKNYIVLVDRYYLSSAAYQGALNAFSLEYVLEKNSFALKPDLWLILDVPVSLGQSRLHDRDKKCNEDQLEIPTYQQEVRENYRKLANMDIGGKIEWIDASIDEEKLTINIGTLILQFLKNFEEHF